MDKLFRPGFEPYEGKEPYVFVSYSRKDAKRVRPILEAMNRAGYRVWYDAGIQAGDAWRESLIKHIRQCAVFLAFPSPAFNSSKNCATEIFHAGQAEKTIVPIYLEAMKKETLHPSFRFMADLQDLRRYQFDSDAAFVERLGRESVFAPCKVPPLPPEEMEPKPPNKKPLNLRKALAVFGVLCCLCCAVLWYLYLKYDISEYTYNDIMWILKRSTGVLTITSGYPHMDYEFQYFEKNVKIPIKNVVIKDGVPEIGEAAFMGCTSLTSVTIPDSVIMIRNYAFDGCASLTDVTIPNRVTAIGDDAFANCISLTHVIIPDSVTTIGDNAFFNCCGLTAVTIPDSVTTIGECVFYSCTSLTDVTISDSVTTIGFLAFWHCTNLTTVTIPDSVTTIEKGAFQDCTSLISVEIPAGASYVESGEDASFPPETQIIRRPSSTT